MIGSKSIPPTEGGGGIERHVEELAARLVARGHHVIVYVRKRSLEEKSVRYRGTTLVGMPSIVTKHFDTYTYALFASIAACFKKEPDMIIHYHGIGPATLAWIPRVFKPSAKVIVTFHSLDRFHQKWGVIARMFLRYAEWAAVTFPHETIAVSRAIQTYSRKRFQKEIVHIPNGTEIKPYPGSDLLHRFGLKKEAYLLTTARFVPQKGIHYLINAYAKMDTDKKLVIAGGGAPGSDYEAYIRGLAEGNPQIVFTGFQTGSVLDQLYANAYLYVHPSEAEGLSMSILEAMAAERCTLVSDIPENKECIDNSGLTFRSGDVSDLREKMENLLRHPGMVEERGARGKVRVSREYNWESVVEKTEKVYKE
jgi:glycosyltransferase involved in cell wall biosynthesis